MNQLTSLTLSVIHFKLLKGIPEQELCYNFIFIMTRMLFIFILLFSFNVFSNEYVNRDFNLKLLLPDNYKILDKVTISEVIQSVENEGLVSTDNLEQLKNTVSNNDNFSVLYLVDDISLVTRNDNIMDNISISTTSNEVEILDNNQMQDWCTKRLINLGKSENREIRKFECYISDRIKGSIFTKYHQYENEYPNSFQAMYSTWFKPNKIIVVTLTCHVSTCDNHIKTFHEIVASMEHYGTFDSIYEQILNVSITNEEMINLIKELNIIFENLEKYSTPCDNDIKEFGRDGWGMENCHKYWDNVYLKLKDEDNNNKVITIASFFAEQENNESFSKNEQAIFKDLLTSSTEIWGKLIAPINTLNSINN